jgi:uncharacterized RDD family membrane protein YckC
MSDLTTSEASTSAPLGGRGERLAAAILDNVLNTLVLVAGFGLGAVVGDGAGGMSTVFAVLGLIGWVLYAPLSMQLLDGATPAKAAFGLWVAREDGRPAGFGIGFARDVILKWVLSILVIVDPLLVLIRPDRKALHDLMIGTTVRSRPR